MARSASAAAACARRALIVIDMAVEQMANISWRKHDIVTYQRSLLEQNNDTHFFDVIVDCRLWLHSGHESTLSWVYPEWGTTLGIPGSAGADIIPELKELLRPDIWIDQEEPFKLPEKRPFNAFVAKKHYSCFVDTQLKKLLTDAEVSEAYLVGINTDYCVFDTALDCQARGRLPTHVIESGVSTLSGQEAHIAAIDLTRRHLGFDSVVDKV
eukprot:CAMPEP_0206457964 /NCGR_PEP_ID=MMETSP0324_2-20121206/23279_1 /ASSEMBLY_ACC=CAM_ASM_000836 /TAXON_ID=2866 /ORGANISM="Crypthecodinium cohnii, Strain Seligo" /LENGTH=211 /DNA_ID=CAMNT_0053929195 /DNA_START=32 /DNA_END=667 /DNA_ORIENTATION=-